MIGRKAFREGKRKEEYLGRILRKGVKEGGRMMREP
jgi:hypothetical protein